MQIWIDSTNQNVIETANAMGLIYGVTTNPSILAASGSSPQTTINNLLLQQAGPVAVQVTHDDVDSMLKQARNLSQYNKRIIIKIPATADGFKAMKQLSSEGIQVLATTILNSQQLYLSSVIGAKYAAPYLATIDQLQGSYQEEMMRMLTIIQKQNLMTKIMAAAITKIEQVLYCAEIGIPAITLPEKIFNELIDHVPSVSDCLKKFRQDWKNKDDALFKVC